MELLGKLASNDPSEIVTLPSASNNVSINFEEKCLRMITNNDRLNGIKGGTKIQKRESLFKYQPCLYNVKRNDDVKHKCMKLRRYNKKFHH